MSSAPQNRPATHGSRTQTIAPTPADESGAGPSSNADPPVGVLKLRGGPTRKGKVVWSEGTVDNEGMGRKKSKICCIYHKPRAFDESSSESGSSSECDGDHGESSRRANVEKGKGKGRHEHGPVGLRRKSAGQGGAAEVESEESSESEGGGGDGRARPVRKGKKHHRHHQHHHDDANDGHDCVSNAPHDTKPNRYDAQPRSSGPKGSAT